MTTRVKMYCELSPDEDGYPPANVESLWVERCGENHYKVDNIPYFVQGIALGDIVTVFRDSDGLPWFEKVVQPSGHSTLRVLFSDDAKVEPIRQMLERLGCISEVSHIRKLIAFDVPPGIVYERIKNFLDEQERNGHLEYEEACIAAR